MTKQEIWKPINGYEGLYEISNMGRLRSLDRIVGAKNGSTRSQKGLVLSWCKTKDGYNATRISKNGVSKSVRAARLVAETFLGTCMGMEVNHINRKRDDDRVENLEWVSHAENVRHSRDSYSRPGHRNGRSKLNQKQVRKIKSLSSKGMTGKNISKMFGVTPATIYKILRGISYVE